MKKYLITGCAGFIGSNFVYYMLKKYDDILLVNLDKLTYAGNLENLKGVEGDNRHVFVQGDICDKELVAGLFEKYDFDYVINFAAESHVDRSIANPEIFVQTNVMGTVNLLQRSKEAWYDAVSKIWKEGKKYLQVSTDEVYGALGADGYFMETTPINPHSPYASSKASADHFVKAFHDTYGMPINITRCSNNYGPYQFPEKLIPLMINNVKHHKQLPVYGDGMQIRDWLYVEDHCKAIDMVANSGKIGEVYNVGGHNERPNVFIVKTIIEQLHDRLKDDGISEDLIKHVEDRLGHDRRYGIDPTKIKNDLGWYPETPFEKNTELMGHYFGRARFRRTSFLRSYLGSRPRYVPFEKIELPVFENVEEYLVARFGDKWMELPSQETRDQYPIHMINSDLFFFQCLKPGRDGHSHISSSWLINAKTNNKILMAVRELCYAYWKECNRLIDYFLLHDFIAIVLEFYPEDWLKIVPRDNAAPHILYLRLFEQYDEKVWRSIKEQTPFHKLSYKYKPGQDKLMGTYYDALFGELEKK